jgi:dTDP-4-amino-4,6-dideoxygalactose transaminase
MFEEKLAKFAGSKFAILTDCCTNGLYLSLRYRMEKGELSSGETLEIPRQTYISVPMLIKQLGLQFKLVDKEWSGLYELGHSGVWDSAARFTSGMFVGERALQVLSFQIKKRLPIGRGGVVLTNDSDANHWIRRAAYDGRDLTTKYTDANHVSQIGWHYYMTPEDAARGILIMDQLPLQSPDTMDWSHYPPIDQYEVFRK